MTVQQGTLGGQQQYLGRHLIAKEKKRRKEKDK